MDLTYLLLLIPLGAGIIALISLFDLQKRSFPSKNLQQIFSVLILFPPILGPVLYYFIVVRKNRYLKIAKKNRKKWGQKKMGLEKEKMGSELF